MTGKLLRISGLDNVAVALSPIARGDELFAGEKAVTALEDIPQGHKIALEAIPAGGDVVKYGCPVGRASADIAAGSWVHTRNMRTRLSGEVEYRYEPAVPSIASEEPEDFMGFCRDDGKAASRNEIWIIPAVGCVNGVAKRLAEASQDLVRGSIEGLYAFSHPYGCSQTGEDHARTRKLLAALARHPNAAAVLVLFLGCENLQPDEFKAELGSCDGRRVKFLVCQDAEDELAAGRALLEECAEYASRFERRAIPASSLVVGLKCGGSDGLSGITANPAAGAFSDMLIARGGSAILTEVPEMFGAEGMLLNRCATREVFDKAAAMLNSFKDYFISRGEPVYENPSPGNKAGGITTLEEKSCGCVQKGGSAPIAAVIGYGEAATERGLSLLSGPGNDLVSATALAAAGAHIILFTTGRGTPFGAPVPTLKIASNSRLAASKPRWIDFDAGPIAEGEPVKEAGRRLYSLVLRAASGERTKSELMGFREIAIFKDGVTL